MHGRAPDEVARDLAGEDPDNFCDTLAALAVPLADLICCRGVRGRACNNEVASLRTILGDNADAPTADCTVDLCETVRGDPDFSCGEEVRRTFSVFVVQSFVAGFVGAGWHD